MMGGVSPEKCRAIKKHWNSKFCCTVASCWFFLWDLYYDARIHKRQIYFRITLLLYNGSQFLFFLEVSKPKFVCVSLFNLRTVPPEQSIINKKKCNLKNKEYNSQFYRPRRGYGNRNDRECRLRVWNNHYYFLRPIASVRSTLFPPTDQPSALVYHP